MSGADAVVLVTEWHEFSELDWGEVAQAMRGDLWSTGATPWTPTRFVPPA